MIILSCGCVLDGSENDPKTIQVDDEHGTMCIDCYYDECFYECCLCCEDEEEGDWHHEWIAVFECDEAGVEENGIYKIVSSPYFVQPVVGHGRLFDFAVHRVADLPELFYCDYSCGYLCRLCQRNYSFIKGTAP